jgi:endoglucanase
MQAVPPRRLWVSAPLLAGLVACAVAPGLPRQTGAATGPVGVRVQGNHLVNAAGATIRLLGVSRSGTEYMCVTGNAIFDGPSDAASIAAIAGWHTDAVRIPLNEDCWLGINGVSPSWSGAAYQQAIHRYVAGLHAAGLAAVLDLHWAAPGATLATAQLPMADADHAPVFWTSVAQSFRTDPDVAFDLYNEPFLDTSNAQTADPWACWRDGCIVNAGNGTGAPWRSAGMQQLVNAVRSAGATQPILLGGLRRANDLTGWLSHRPIDPSGQTAASFHLYNFNQCVTGACWDGQIAPVAASVPVVTGELGENDCAHGFIDGYMSWADAHGVSYLGWAWNSDFNCNSGPGLVSDDQGTPTGFGIGLRDHLAAVAGGQAPQGR